MKHSRKISPAAEVAGNVRADGVAKPSEPADPEVMLQSGALPYRRAGDGKLEVLLIGKKRANEWGIPKGKVEPHLTFSENAAKEAYEEAGVQGVVSADFVGRFRDTKRTRYRLGRRTIEVWVYLLEVQHCLSDWPEKGTRQLRWVSCETAATLLREPVLAQLCACLLNAEPNKT